MTKLLLFVVAVAFVSVCVGQPAFEGVWSSSYGGGGGVFNICQNKSSGRMQGVYSRIGFIDGFTSVDPNTSRLRFDGTWFEGGARGFKESATVYQPNYGPIVLFRSADGKSLTGAYSYAGTILVENTTDPNFQWSETIISTTAPAASDCWFSEYVAPDNGIPDHRWTCCQGTNWNLVSNSPIVDPAGGVEGSYLFTDNTRGATIGACNKTSGICQFDYYETNPSFVNSGMWLARQVSANTFYAFGWTGFITDFVYTTNPDIFGSYTWTKSAVTPTSADASANRALLCQNGLATCPSTTAPPGTTPSTGSKSKSGFPVGAIVGIVIAAIVIFALILVAVIFLIRRNRSSSYEAPMKPAYTAPGPERPVPESMPPGGGAWPGKTTVERPPADGYYDPNAKLKSTDPTPQQPTNYNNNNKLDQVDN